MKYMPFVRVLLPLLVALLHSASTLALPVSGLYSQRIAVANESDAERSRAIREALQAVVLKVTGDPRWVEHPSTQRAIENAQSYVEAISYSSEMVAEPDSVTAADVDAQQGADAEIDAAGDPDLAPEVGNQNARAADATAAPRMREQRYINVDFARTLIDEMLAAADIPIWDSNRPSVLVWMVLQDASGERHMLTTDSNPEIVALVQEFARVRGVPIIFPVLDFEDRRSLNEDQVWALDEAVIRNASVRYGADSILSGRLYFTPSGELVGLWQFLFQDQAEVFDGFAIELRDYLYDPLNRITSQLAGYFAITPEDAPRHTVRLRVDGIDDLQAYSALLSYIGNLGVVEGVTTTALQGERIELTLNLLGNSQQLDELIALDRDLLPIESSRGQRDQFLHYRWTR